MDEDEGKIAICGYSLTLPGGIRTGDQLVELIRQKQQMRRDMVQTGRYHESLIDQGDTGNPWKLKSRFANLFTDEEGKVFIYLLILYNKNLCFLLKLI